MGDHQGMPSASWEKSCATCHDDARMAADYKLVDEYLKMEKPYDIKTAYTNEFLNKSVKMPPINPPKLY